MKHVVGARLMYMEYNANVDVPNLVSNLKGALKVCGCYLIRVYVLQLLLIRNF